MVSGALSRPELTVVSPEPETVVRDMDRSGQEMSRSADPELDDVVAAWPMLSQPIKLAILRLVEIDGRML